ncbi:unnamed protein product [Pelagomonas calceolata]|uniref:Uncharacterized protein n=1 Tax=Pelagomonas calceolata TaxID=35677 RepID=A0A8J2X6X7_9STRA|nr:unnamed protein product [Pelagomonas calceolata]
MRTVIGALLLSGVAGLAPAQQHKKLKLAAAPLLPAILPSVAVAAADSYEYGSARLQHQRAQVAAPDWVLPAGAVLAIATALLPLARALAMPTQALKDGEEAAEEIFQQDESVRSLDSRKNRRV